MGFTLINPFVFGGGGGTPDPEAGLTLTTTFAVGSLSRNDFTRNADAVFACELTIPASPDGLIFELGGVRGTYVGFRSDNSFVVRAGNSGNSPTSSGTGIAVIALSSGQPSGSGTLVWELDVSLGQARAWWNGVSLGVEAATDAQFSNGEWASNADGAYDSNFTGGLVSGETGTGLGASTSTLRYYEAQVSSL